MTHTLNQSTSNLVETPVSFMRQVLDRTRGVAPKIGLNVLSPNTLLGFEPVSVLSRHLNTDVATRPLPQPQSGFMRNICSGRIPSETHPLAARRAALCD
jgi:hypothetical protein